MSDETGMKAPTLFTTMCVRAAPQDAVPASMRKTEATGRFWHPRTRAMQDRANGFQRTLLPRTPVNRTLRNGLGASIVKGWVGLLDEMVVVPIGVLLAAMMIPPDVFEECREKAREVAEGEKPVSRIAAVVIVAVWVLCVALAVFLALGVF